MFSNEIAIKVENLSKCYNIYNQPQDRLKQSIFPRLQASIGRVPKTYFHEFWALRNVSFEIRKGETIGIIGRNGSGKSTLLQLICGTLTPTLGTVQTRGRIAALLELGSGFNPEFTGRENVLMNGAVLGLTTEEINERFADIAAFADIGDFIEQPVKMYSSGMVVRLAFAVQAMVDPDILIVDEALAVGDERFQRKCFARLEELKSQGTSILFVSHSGPQIVQLCEKALLLEHGSRLLYAQPMHVVRAYQKLIYAPPDQQEILAQEYSIADQSDLDLATLGSRSSVVETNDENKKSYFDAGLISETATVYPIQGAEILSLQILDADGQAANMLAFGQDYRFEVSGRFLADREKVFFGIHIRTISGVEITGQRYPEEGKYIEEVHTGEHFRITYGFKMILSPGTYFSGCAVWSFNEPVCLHRIIDAIMFRVVPSQKKDFGGYVDLSSVTPTLEIS
jgi:homopolymeric O-antigen transport system ATP-binding protein